ncbi:MAG: purine-binding chemotaxis protein CheW [Ruminococcus sp.]|nr:purine-binding chemotaxis protein CheW [Ruminococcus sp.]
MAADRTSAGQLLTFGCADQIYAFDIISVTDIIEVPEITRLPMVAEHILGIMNLRGKVVPVMDFAGRMGFPPQNYDEHSCIIVVDCEGALLGIKVPKVIDAEAYDPDEVSPSPVENSVITGYIELKGRRISVIDCLAFSEKGK